MKIWEKFADFWKSYKGLYVEKRAIAVSWEGKKLSPYKSNGDKSGFKVAFNRFSIEVLAISLDTRLA